MRGVSKPGVDWGRARELYQLGAMTLDEIGAEVGCTRWAVIKRREKEGWRRPSDPESPGGVDTHANLPALPEFKPLGTKDSPERRAAVLEAVGKGMPLGAAAAYAGVTDDTLKRWRDLDSEFSDEIVRAAQVWHRKRLANIEKSCDRGDWKADAWLLERHPATREHYKTAQSAGGPSINVLISVQRGDPVAIPAVVIDGKVAA